MVRLLASQCAATVGANPSLAITISAEPRHTSPSVRRPVGLPCRSRLSPIAAPIRVAAASRRTISDNSIMAVLAPGRRLAAAALEQIFAEDCPVAEPAGQPAGVARGSGTAIAYAGLGSIS